MLWSKSSSGAYIAECLPVVASSFLFNIEWRSNTSLKSQIRCPSYGLVGIEQRQPTGSHPDLC